MTSNDLTCVCCYFNPASFRVHQDRYTRFAQHMHMSGVRLVTVECVFPGQTYAVTQANHPDHVQVKSRTPLWVKENLLNLGWPRCTTPYVMWADADIEFEDHYWPFHTIGMLQSFPIAVPFSLLLHRGPNQELMAQQRNIASGLTHQPEFLPGLPVLSDTNGIAWAFRREVLTQLGGLFDEHILGDGDDVMAYALAGRLHDVFRPGMNPVVLDHIRRWVVPLATLSFAAVAGQAYHQWHGPIRSRGYGTRWKILTEEHFNPDRDLVRNDDGVWECTKTSINRRIMQYFHSRQEDA